MSIPEEAKKQMQQTVEHLQKELKNLRTGRATPGLIEEVQVEAYGATMPLKSVATITVAEARKLSITPFDPSMTAAISKSIELADLGMMPAVNGATVFVSVPALTGETRQKLVKEARKKAEDTKISIREARKRANNQAKEEEKKGTLTKDELSRIEKEVQKHTDAFCKQVDEMVEKKEKEITTV